MKSKNQAALLPPSSPAPITPVEIADYARLAPAHLSSMAWEYVSGAAADETTLRWNEAAYGKIRLRPRNLVDVSHIETKLSLFGQNLECPILLAPVAYQRLAHPEGECATVQGAEAAGATIVLSTFSTVSLEEVAGAATKPHWFQLYVQPDRDFTRELVRRAEAAGYKALVVTVDTPVLGPRYRELRHKFSLPEGMERANLKGLHTATGGHRPTERNIFSATLDPKLTWKDIAWLRSLTSLPVILKGVMNAGDAGRAVDEGASGLVVSNHGGRNLDTVPATIDALPEVAAKVAGRFPILVDGGIRHGTDILKALALGASAVLIGRPYVYGLAVGGADGVSRVVNILRREFEMAMALTGKTSLTAIDRSVLWE
ncbi:MAG TPA: alpha-hydroxy acid oxidase [Lacunisphaera sp.]|jgi:4-hydroxymandelate oxidase